MIAKIGLGSKVLFERSEEENNLPSMFAAAQVTASLLD